MSVIIPPFTTSTNLGPMTTRMSFPTDCLSRLFDFNTKGLGLYFTYQTQGCALRTCCPSGNFYTEGLAWLTSYYSPAVCPADYKTCALPSSYTTFSSVSGESIVLCCPNSKQDVHPSLTPNGIQESKRSRIPMSRRHSGFVCGLRESSVHVDQCCCP